MVTRNQKINSLGYQEVTYYGLSTDTKPLDAPNGSAFVEMNTKDLYFFDAENKIWYKQ